MSYLLFQDTNGNKILLIGDNGTGFDKYTASDNGIGFVPQLLRVTSWDNVCANGYRLVAGNMQTPVADKYLKDWIKNQTEVRSPNQIVLGMRQSAQVMSLVMQQAIAIGLGSSVIVNGGGDAVARNILNLENDPYKVVYDTVYNREFAQRSKKLKTQLYNIATSRNRRTGRPTKFAEKVDELFASTTGVVVVTHVAGTTMPTTRHLDAEAMYWPRGTNIIGILYDMDTPYAEVDLGHELMHAVRDLQGRITGGWLDERDHRKKELEYMDSRGIPTKENYDKMFDGEEIKGWDYYINGGRS